MSKQLDAFLHEAQRVGAPQTRTTATFQPPPPTPRAAPAAHHRNAAAHWFVWHCRRWGPRWALMMGIATCASVGLHLIYASTTRRHAVPPWLHLREVGFLWPDIECGALAACLGVLCWWACEHLAGVSGGSASTPRPTDPTSSGDDAPAGRRPGARLKRRSNALEDHARRRPTSQFKCHNRRNRPRFVKPSPKLAWTASIVGNWRRCLVSVPMFPGFFPSISLRIPCVPAQ